MYKNPWKLTNSSRLQYVIMTTNNRHYLFSKWRAVVRRARPSHTNNFNWWASLKWIRWTLARICTQVINSYFLLRFSTCRCALPNNFGTLQKMVTHRIIRFLYGSWFSCNHLPNVGSKSVREIDIKNRSRIVALMDWTDVPEFNPILLVSPENAFIYFSPPVSIFAQFMPLRSWELTVFKRIANVLNSETTFYCSLSVRSFC